VISLRGADNYDSLRGVGLDFVVLDEVADIHPEVWTEVIRPALSDRMGCALFIGTPRGFNHCTTGTTPHLRSQIAQPSSTQR
jgi:hypothetical protein